MLWTDCSIDARIAGVMMSSAPLRNFIARYFGPTVVFALFLLAWYALAYGLENNFSPASNTPMIIPPPHRLFEDIHGIVRTKILIALWISLKTTLVGLTLSICIGLVAGVLMAQAKWLERSIWPYLIALQVTPIIAIVPLIIKLVGSNFAARVLVTVIISLFPIVSNTLFGIQSTPKNMHDLFTLHKSGRATRLLKLQLPAASPAIFSGLRISAGLAVIGAIVGDFFFAKGDPGLGKLITQFFLNSQAGPMFVTALMATLLGLTLFIAFGLLSNWVVGRWYEGSISQ
jgi:NitT/TauT family transport system permease protein